MSLLSSLSLLVARFLIVSLLLSWSLLVARFLIVSLLSSLSGCSYSDFDSNVVVVIVSC